MLIDRDIRKAATLPGSFYRNREYFERTMRTVFADNWNFVGSVDDMRECNTLPVDLLPGVLDEPLILTRDRAGSLHCLSNVCTHRGALVVDEPANNTVLRCPYHGRCFGLDGKFRSMPGFEEVENFPAEADDLASVPVRNIGPVLLANLSEGASFDEQFGEMLSVMAWFDFDDLEYRGDVSRDYSVQANWALYVDNYLEGFHVPFVHPGLNEALEFEEYSIELYKKANLQIGVADPSEVAIHKVPQSSPFHGRRIYAFYWWVFPNIMFNFYPWGVSLNVVEPIAIDQTRIRFLTYVRKGAQSPDMAGIHKTEVEDEVVVESVQRGIRSSLYDRGRYSSRHEKAVHHFHRLLTEALHV